MPALDYRQTDSADIRRSDSQGWLVVSRAPAAANALIGKRLLDCGTIDVEGDYACDIATHDWQDVDVYLKPSAVTGTVLPSIHALRYDKESYITTTAAGGNLSAASVTTISLSDIKGVQKVRVTFSVGAGEDIEFDNTAVVDPTVPDAVAEFRGL